MMVKRLFGLVVLCLICSSCATTTYLSKEERDESLQFRPEQGMANLYITLKSRALGHTIKNHFYVIDSSDVAYYSEITFGSFAHFQLEPGEYTIISGRQSAKIVLESDENHYYEFLRRIYKNKAEKMLAKQNRVPTHTLVKKKFNKTWALLNYGMEYSNVINIIPGLDKRGNPKIINEKKKGDILLTLDEGLMVFKEYKLKNWSLTVSKDKIFYIGDNFVTFNN
ncbi:MAG: hypothetical protein K8S27_15945 [Candidatus Omnitrophica bacterium]|nr:hypothetical protein [Candidatus Omnitrophota bacterium]